MCTTISPALPYALFDRSVSNASEVERYNGNVVFEGIIDCAKAALEPRISRWCWATTWAAVDHPSTTSGGAVLLPQVCGGVQRLRSVHRHRPQRQMAGIGQETGTLEPGKAADLIVTAADPLADLRALRHVELVMSLGQLHRAPQVKHRKNVEAELDRFL